MKRLFFLIGILFLISGHAQNSSFQPSLQELNWSRWQQNLGLSDLHQKGFLGQGSSVAVLDTGFSLNHSEFQGSFIQSPKNILNGSSDVSDILGHGTQVSSLIFAQANQTGIVGVAPLSTFIPVAVFSGSTAPASFLANGISYALDQNARVINMSLGASSSLGDEVTRQLARSADRALVVVAAGNQSAATPNFPGQYANAPWMQSSMLVVGSVNSSLKLSDFSNQAGSLSPYYLVAPGEGLISARMGDGYNYVSGTSMAAPIVSGTASLIFSQWPWLRPNQVAQILLQTSDDLGSPGVDTVYGHGLINPTKAMEPVGPLTYTQADGTTSTLFLQGRQILLTPFGTSSSPWRSLRTYTFDDYQRSYLTSLDFSTSSSPLLLSDLFRHFITPTPLPSRSFINLHPFDFSQWSFGFIAAHDRVAHSRFRTLSLHESVDWSRFLSTSSRYVSTGFFSPIPQLYLSFVDIQSQPDNFQDDDRVRGRLQQADGILNLSPQLSLAGTYSSIKEHQGLFGGQLPDVYGFHQNTSTQAATLTLHYWFHPNWQWRSTLTHTRTPPLKSQGLLKSSSTLEAQQWSISLLGQNLFQSGDRFTFLMESPLRFTSGDLHYQTATDVTDDGQPVFSSTLIPIRSSTPEMQWHLYYQHSFNHNHLSYGLSYQKNPHHDQRPSQWVLGAQWKHPF